MVKLRRKPIKPKLDKGNITRKKILSVKKLPKKDDSTIERVGKVELRILALDVATRTGWCMADGSGYFDSKAKKDESKMKDQVIDVASAGDTGTAPVEEPLSPGTESWGRWTHSESQIYLELNLEDEERGRGMDVKIAAGSFVVEFGEKSLLSGKLAQPVLIDDMTWGVEETKLGHRVLSIELPKKFDLALNPFVFNSLSIRSENCRLPGLTSMD